MSSITHLGMASDKPAMASVSNVGYTQAEPLDAYSVGSTRDAPMPGDP
jgi:hypothetical protein